MMNQGNGKKPNGGNKSGPIPPTLLAAFEQLSFDEFKQELESAPVDRGVAAQLLRLLCEKSPKPKDDMKKLDHLVKVGLNNNPYISVSEKNPEDSPVVKAFENGRFDYLRVLLSCKEPKLNNSTYEQVMSALMFGLISKYDKMREHCSSVIKLLVDTNHMKIINSMQRNGNFLMMEAIKKNNPQLVQDLLQMGPNLDLPDKSGSSCWKLAQQGNKEILQMLSEYKEASGGMSSGRGNGANNFIQGNPAANMQGGQAMGGKGSKADNRRGVDNSGVGGMQYSQHPQAPGMNNSQMNQGYQTGKGMGGPQGNNLGPGQGVNDRQQRAGRGPKDQNQMGLGQNMQQQGNDNMGNLSNYSKNNGGSSHNMNVPSSNQSTLGTEASKKSTGVRIVGKVPEANKLKVHSAKADNSSKASRAGGSKKYYDQHGHPESELGDDTENSHMMDSISKVDSSIGYGGGSEYTDHDYSEHGGHKPRSLMGRMQIGHDSKQDRNIDEQMSMSSKNKYDSKNDGYSNHMDHNEKQKGKDGFNKQGEEDEYHSRQGYPMQHMGYNGPMGHGDPGHMHRMPEPGYKNPDGSSGMSRGDRERDRNGGYQHPQQGYQGYQQGPKAPSSKTGKIKGVDEQAMYAEQKMPRNMYMPPPNGMQEPYAPHSYNYMQQPGPMHPPNSKPPKIGMSYPIGGVHDRQEGFDPNMPNPSIIDGMFPGKPGDQRIPNMPIPYSNTSVSGKGGHPDHPSHSKYSSEELPPGGKFGKYPGHGMYENNPVPYEVGPGMVPAGMPVHHMTKNPPQHPNQYIAGPPSAKEGTSTSSRDGNLHKRILELEQQIKEREAAKNMLAKAEVEAMEERNKAQQELENIQGVFESYNYVETDNKDCTRCYSIFNLNNTINKTDLNSCLHKEISTFESTILAINEQEKPLLDGLIKQMEEIIAQIFPDSSLHIFGSFSTGLCLPWSDIDILLDAGQNMRNYDSDILAKVEEHLGKFPDVVKTRKYVRGATFPVLKIECTSQYNKKKMDITIKENRHSGLMCVNLVKEYLAEYQIVLRPFVFVLKQMVYLSGLNDPFTGGINSYGLILMVVSYLQAEFKRGITKEDMSMNLGLYFLNFLNYYGNTLNYNMVELRPSTVADFKADMPDPFTHRQTMDLQPNQSSLVIQDPLQRSNNVTRSTFAFNIIRMIFSYSYLSVFQPCICEISQLMNNPKSISDHTKIEGVFNQKLNFPAYGYLSQGLVILTKILNAHKNLIFMAFISRKQNGGM